MVIAWHIGSLWFFITLLKFHIIIYFITCTNSDFLFLLLEHFYNLYYWSKYAHWFLFKKQTAFFMLLLLQRKILFSCTDISVNTVHDRVQQITFKSFSFDTSCVLILWINVIKVNALNLSIWKTERFPEVFSLAYSFSLLNHKQKQNPYPVSSPLYA